MSYFLFSGNLGLGKPVELFGEEARHILLSRRIKPGEEIDIQGINNKRFLCEVVRVGKKTLEVLPKQEKPIPEEPEKSISLFMASVSESAWDMVLQKTTELGVKKIHLFSSQNSPKKMSLEDFQKKLRRWEKILWEAAKQSGRGKIPDLVFLKDLDEVLEKTKDLDVVYLCDASGIGLEPITYPPAGGLKPAGLFVGPEGGFTEAEIDKIKKLKNCQLLKLSNFTLRAETAAIAGVAKILF